MLPHIWTQLWPLLIALAVIGFFFYKGRGKIKTGDFSDPASAASGEMVEADEAGLHQRSGTTHGVAWRVEVLRLASEVDDGTTVRRSTSVNFTRWTAPQCKPASGRLLIMHLPEGQDSAFVEAAPAEGLVGQLKAQAARLALQVYVRQRFGAARAAAPFDPNQRVPLEGDIASRFAMWCDDPELTQRLTGPVREWLAEHHASGVAILWDEQGLTLHRVTPTVTTDAIEATAREGAELVNLLQG